MRLKRIIILAVLLALSIRADDPPGHQLKDLDFMKQIREIEFLNSWVDLDGRIKHYKGKSIKNRKLLAEADLKLTGRFEGNKSRIQLKVDNSEITEVIQNVKAADEVTVRKLQAAKDPKLSLKAFNISPEFLSMAFLFWDVQEQAKPVYQKVSIFKCRVFNLKSSKGELINVYISTKFLSPIRVEWLGENNKVIRKLEVDEVYPIRTNQDNKFYVIKKIKFIQGDELIDIRFPFKKGDEVNDENPVPKDLFIEK